MDCRAGHVKIFSVGVTRMDKIRKEYVRGAAWVMQFGDKERETRLR